MFTTGVNGVIGVNVPSRAVTVIRQGGASVYGTIYTVEIAVLDPNRRRKHVTVDHVQVKQTNVVKVYGMFYQISIALMKSNTCISMFLNY